MRRFLIRFIALCLVVTAGALASALLGQFGPEYLRFLDSFSHFQLYYTLGFTAAMPVLAWLRAWRLVCSATVLSLFAVVPIVPVLVTAPGETIHEQRSETPADSRKILTFNLNYGNGNAQLAAAYIADEDPDIVLLQEVSERNASVLPLLSDYPYKQICPLNQLMSTAILARDPPSRRGCLPGSKLAFMDFADGGAAWRIISVHLHWPWPFGQWAQIEALRTDLTADKSVPTVFGGELNATPWSRAVKTIGALGGAISASGIRLSLFRYDTPFQLPLILPIDHILVPAHWGVMTASTGPDLGSDHRPITISYRHHN